MKVHFNLGKGKVACGGKIAGGERAFISADPLKVTCLSCRASRDVNAMILRDKVTTYEALLHQLHFAAEVAMNADRVRELLRLISSWSFAHRSGNGEHSEQEQAAIVAAAYERLRL